MLRLRPSLPLIAALPLAGAFVLAGVRDARACGGCFHPPPGPTEVDSTVVTDHRMALSISPAQTVLWDQVRYSGNPKDFAWVLPVKPGARIELSQDAWIASLDASTQVVIQGPSPYCPGVGGSGPVDYAGGGGGGGCGFSSSTNDAPASGFGAAEEDASVGADGGGVPPVQVVSQSVVGPYDAVTVRASEGEALGTWLNANGYDVPASIQPTIDAFTAQGFDFIALKLAPGEGVQAMQPVRVITPGADPSLPLRMVAAGVGANVGIELFVLSEGRYHPQNFPDAVIDESKLAWDPYQSRSNYTELATAAMAAGAGDAWLTEYSGSVSLYAGGGNGYNPPLASVYQQTCSPQTLPPPSSCGGGAGGGAADGGSTDGAASDAGGGVDGAAGDDGGGAGEAGATRDDGGAGDDGGACAPTVVACDDLQLAMTGITTGDLWVTRLRADLPVGALASDLVLEADSSQQPVSNVLSTSVYTDPSYNPCPTPKSSATGSSPPSSSSSGGCACRTADSSPRDRYADVIAMSLGAVGLALSLRRRRRR